VRRAIGQFTICTKNRDAYASEAESYTCVGDARAAHSLRR